TTRQATTEVLLPASGFGISALGRPRHPDHARRKHDATHQIVGVCRVREPYIPIAAESPASRIVRATGDEKIVLAVAVPIKRGDEDVVPFVDSSRAYQFADWISDSRRSEADRRPGDHSRKHPIST